MVVNLSNSLLPSRTWFPDIIHLKTISELEVLRIMEEKFFHVNGNFIKRYWVYVNADWTPFGQHL